MNQLPKVLLALSIMVSLATACKKTDHLDRKECQVQQFGGEHNGGAMNGQPVTGPYRFYKTFDASGRVTSIDSYLVKLYSYHVKGTLTYVGKKVYILNSLANDTIMVVWLNSHGRVVVAEARSGFTPYQGIRIEFTYDAENRVSSCSHYPANFPDHNSITFEYDGNGNCKRAGEVTYKYDYTRTAKQQFYFDEEDLQVWWPDLHFLEYLGCFPEITNPDNVRVATSVKGFFDGPEGVIGAGLYDHKFDDQGKLISYVFFGRVQPVIYQCGKFNMMAE